MLKRIGLICLSVALLFSSNATSFADNQNTEIEVISPEFPNAYVIVESSKDTVDTRFSLFEKSKPQGECNVSAKVFVREKYIVEDGFKFVLDSKLLSKEEVMEIGINKFSELSKSSSSKLFSTRGDARDVEGTLVLIMNTTYSRVGNGIEAYTNSTATWSGFNTFYSGYDNPTNSEDAMLVHWGGEYQGVLQSKSNIWSESGSHKIRTADIMPNTGYLFAFNEGVCIPAEYSDYSTVSTRIKLNKNTLTGNGNETKVITKYLHTYSQPVYDLTFSISGEGIGASINLSSTGKEWTLAVANFGLPY